LCEELVRFSTCVPLGQAEQLGARAGIVFSHPFFDLRLVELMLAMPYQVRLRRGVLKAKPLLRRAMRQRLPAAVLARRDAAELSTVRRAALRGPHRAFVQGLFAGSSRLADLGIIRPAAVREALVTEASAPERRLSILVALEIWLRSAWP
jgi:asparagine synthetase B (glutamine-hydrolysing)